MRRVFFSFAAALAIFLSAETADTQELEPRAYSASPIGTNFLILSRSHSAGQIGLDDSLPFKGVTANINTNLFVYARTFNVGGRMGSFTALLPYLNGEISSTLNGQRTTVTRAGFADFAARFVINLLGSPALTPEQFARRKPTTTIGVSESIFAPTGTYSPSRLVNVGTNRWSFLTEVGLEQPIGRAFVDLSTGVRLFAVNTNYFGGTIRTQAPTANVQVHAGYNFRPGFWLAADGTYYTGGAARIDGGTALNQLANSRYGATVAYPFSPGLSTKVFWSHWLAGRYGSNFTVAGLALQYRWFDQP